MPEPSVKFDLSQMFSSVSNVKLPGGVVGKVCTVLLSASAASAVIAWAAHSVWVCVLALVLLFGLCFVMLWRLLSFADRHPQAALLEGAQFLAHEQMRLGMKSTPLLPPSASIIPPGAANPAPGGDLIVDSPDHGQP